MSVGNVKLTGWEKYDKLLIEADEIIKDFERLKRQSTASSFKPKPPKYFNIRFKLKKQK